MMFLGSQGKVFLAKGLDNRLKMWDVVSCKEKALNARASRAAFVAHGVFITKRNRRV